ncbi:MAG: hypothetical protein ACJASQ_001626 [Crocinitomicaceae bacterium]|jgi:hypothetical protein
MIVPTDISPIDYLKESNEFIFVTAEFILRVNYESKYFDLETPEKLVYRRSFEFIKEPSEDFEIIDFGIVEWIRSAVKWNKTKSSVQDHSKHYSVEVEGIIYEGIFNSKNSDITIRIPEKTIICKRESITTDFPEIQHMEYGQLISRITTNIIQKMQRLNQEERVTYHPSLPLEFRPKSITIGENSYGFDYLTDSDLALLMIPFREIKANLLLIETDAPELAELHQGMLYDVIRDVVYENTTI